MLKNCLTPLLNVLSSGTTKEAVICNKQWTSSELNSKGRNLRAEAQSIAYEMAKSIDWKGLLSD